MNQIESQRQKILFSKELHIHAAINLYHLPGDIA